MTRARRLLLVLAAGAGVGLAVYTARAAAQALQRLLRPRSGCPFCDGSGLLQVVDITGVRIDQCCCVRLVRPRRRLWKAIEAEVAAAAGMEES